MLSLPNSKIKLTFSNNEISSNGGIFLYSEFMQNIDLKALLAKNINFSEHSFRKHSPVNLISQKILSLIAGYEDNSDVSIIKKDPVFNLVTDEIIGSQPTLCRLEKDVLHDDIKGFYQADLELLDKVWKKEGRKKITIDLDGTDTICHGHQKGSKYHGYYEDTIYHPLFAFCGETGDLIKGMLRHGSCADSHQAVKFLKPIIDFLLARGYEIIVRADCGFATPLLYEYLEKRNIEYTIRLKRNNRLANIVSKLLPLNKEDVGTGKERFTEFEYQADSWNKKRKVSAKQIYRSNQLFPEYYFVLSTRQKKAKDIFGFYEKRGTAENFIKEGKLDLSFVRLSCKNFLANAFRLQVAILAYNINNIFRRHILPEKLKHHHISTLRTKIINIGCRIIKHARRIICQFGKSFKQERLIQEILQKLHVFHFKW